MEMLEIKEIDETEFEKTKAVTLNLNIFCVTTTEIKVPVVD
jgi:hypothetical protein